MDPAAIHYRAVQRDRVRAGVLEQWVADVLTALGMGERMRREGMFHDGIYLNFEGGLHHLDFRKLIGKGVTIYGQQEVVKDLVAGRDQRHARPAA